jgi:thiamine biosynthesis lipoprotein
MHSTATAPTSGGGVAEWALWSTTARLVVTEPRRLADARALVEDYLAQVDDAANRFRPDSEISTLRPGPGGVVRLSPTLADLMSEALAVAWFTDGDVDPTVGSTMNALGYDRDLRLVLEDSRPVRAVVRPAPGWRTLRLTGDRLALPHGIQLDLGATAKAVAADRAAALAFRELGTGVLVSLGGDIATAGPAPVGGWQVHVQDRAEDPAQQVGLPAGAAIATSSTVSRQWPGEGRVLHHVVDPRTGRPAEPVWRSVTVAASSCVRANAATTAALVRGRRAIPWLERLRYPARLLAADGSVRTINDWPAEVAA